MIIFYRFIYFDWNILAFFLLYRFFNFLFRKFRIFKFLISRIFFYINLSIYNISKYRFDIFFTIIFNNFSIYLNFIDLIFSFYIKIKILLLKICFLIKIDIFCFFLSILIFNNFDFLFINQFNIILIKIYCNFFIK